MNGISFESKKGNKYFYDNRTGQIIYVNNEKDINKLVEKYDSLGFNQIENIPIVTKQELEKFLYKDGNGFKQLIFEVSSACNLRCNYCIYSEHYPFTRGHEGANMSFDTAKKAIDYYYLNFQRMIERNPMRKAVVSFYGGEPLINLKLIKQIVNYIKKNYSEYETNYNITTNGLLFNKEAQEFLHKNKFAILISFDGYRDNHDRNRVDKYGNATFDKILDNMKEYKDRFKKDDLNVAICYDFKTDMRKIMQFIDENNISVAHVAQVQTKNSTYYEQFSDEDKKEFLIKYQDMKQLFFEQVANETYKKEKFLYRFFGSMFGNLAYHPMIGEYPPVIRPYTGTCVPGEKLYVSVNGDFQICEKINCAYKIGNVEDGLDYDAIIKVLNAYNKNVCSDCSKCNISRLCKLCYKDFETDNGFQKDLEVCRNERMTMKNMLSEYVDMMESNPRLFEEITTDYYNFLNKVGEFV